MVTITLKLRRLYEAVFSADGDKVEETANLQAKLLIQKTLDEKHMRQVRGCITAQEMMSRLVLI